MKGNLSRGGQGKFDGRPEQAGQKISLQAAASKVKSIPTQTEIVISLLKQNLSPDRLNLAHEQSVQDLLDLNLRGDRAAEEEQTSGKLLRREIVLCSDAVLKQNKRGKVQDRIFLITDRCIYNLLPGSFKCKRRVFLNDILGVSFTHDSDDFLVHFMDQKDYWLISDRRNDILIELDKAFSAFCPDKSLSYQLISSSELTHFFGKSIAPNDESPNKKVVFLSDRDHDEQHDAGESGEEDAREKISSSIDNDHARSKTSLRKSRGMDAGVSKIRALVSKKKIRFLEDGFDLDLTYITKNIIAMGFPSEDLEGIYRNPMSEVQRFFETRHPNRYKIFNLCSERQYDHMKFQKRVSHYGFDDHNCPSMKQIIDLCEEVHSWLRESDENVVSIHCKAGKGRTGLMISCYLLFSQILPNPQDALKFFGVNRTSNGKGVTIPSQKRYVYYFNRFLHEYYWCSPQKPFPFSGKPFVLTSVVFSSVPRIDSTNGCTPFFKIHRLDGRKIYDSRKIVKPKNFVNESGKRKLISKFSSSASSIEISCAARVRGDVKISFFHEDVYSFDKPMFHCWINTVFLYDNHIVLKKHELDKAVKDTGHKKYDEDFCIEMIFRPDDISVVEVDQVESNESFLKSIRDGNKDPWDAEKLCEKLKDLELELAEERKLCNSLVSQIEEFNEENDGLSLQIAALKSHPSM